MSTRMQLLAVTRERARELRDRCEATDAEGPALRPGSVFCLPSTASHLVEWAILDRFDDEESGEPRLLVVPADGFPELGPGDVSTRHDAPCGYLALRCGLGLWVGAQAFQGAERSCILPTDALHHAWTLWCRLEQRGGMQAVEEELEIGYQEWLQDVLLPARRALESTEPPSAAVAELPARAEIPIAEGEEDTAGEESEEDTAGEEGTDPTRRRAATVQPSHPPPAADAVSPAAHPLAASLPPSPPGRFRLSRSSLRSSPRLAALLLLAIGVVITALFCLRLGLALLTPSPRVVVPPAAPLPFTGPAASVPPAAS